MSEKTYKLKPTGNMLWVDPIEAKKETAGGIILPEQVVERPTVSLVISVGPGQRSLNGDMIPIDAQPGDLVLHHRHALQHCKTPDGDSFSLIAEGDILAKLIEVEEESNG